MSDFSRRLMSFKILDKINKLAIGSPFLYILCKFVRANMLNTSSDVAKFSHILLHCQVGHKSFTMLVPPRLAPELPLAPFFVKIDR